jgi:hypothetical protein
VHRPGYPRRQVGGPDEPGRTGNVSQRVPASGPSPVDHHQPPAGDQHVSRMEVTVTRGRPVRRRCQSAEDGLTLGGGQAGVGVDSTSNPVTLGGQVGRGQTLVDAAMQLGEQADGPSQRPRVALHIPQQRRPLGPLEHDPPSTDNFDHIMGRRHRQPGCMNRPRGPVFTIGPLTLGARVKQFEDPARTPGIHVRRVPSTNEGGRLWQADRRGQGVHHQTRLGPRVGAAPTIDYRDAATNDHTADPRILLGRRVGHCNEQRTPQHVHRPQFRPPVPFGLFQADTETPPKSRPKSPAVGAAVEPLVAVPAEAVNEEASEAARECITVVDVPSGKEELPVK